MERRGQKQGNHGRDSKKVDIKVVEGGSKVNLKMLDAVYTQLWNAAHKNPATLKAIESSSLSDASKLQLSYLYLTGNIKAKETKELISGSNNDVKKAFKDSGSAKDNFFKFLNNDQLKGNLSVYIKMIKDFHHTCSEHELPPTGAILADKELHAVIANSDDGLAKANQINQEELVKYIERISDMDVDKAFEESYAPTSDHTPVEGLVDKIGDALYLQEL